MSEQKFNAHRLFTTEINAIFYTLTSKITAKDDIKLRHINLQLVDDDRNHDLLVSLQRKHEEILQNEVNIRPIDICRWTVVVRNEVESYGPAYWDNADDFFGKVLSSSLKKYLKEGEFLEDARPTIKRWLDYISNLMKRKSELNVEINNLNNEKHRVNSEVSSLVAQRTKLEASISKSEERVSELGKIKDALAQRVKLENQVKELRDEKHQLDSDITKLKQQKKLALSISKVLSKFGL